MLREMKIIGSVVVMKMMEDGGGGDEDEGEVMEVMTVR